jgi:ubiquinone biosynthesis protein
MSDSIIPRVDPDAPGVLASLPRRTTLNRSPDTTPPAQMRALNFTFSKTQAVWRVIAWLGLLLQFTLATTADVVLRRDSLTRRARRWRLAFERRGGSFAKLGVHLSMRADFMPWEYSVELSRTQDQMQPFKLESAIEIIQRSLGHPLPVIFSQFDPQPIASNSVACIYEAVLHSGEHVAVKVRRPGVGAQFMADLQAFDWLLILAEILTIYPPGLTAGMRAEFRTYLLEELDFVEAARRQDSFRRAADRLRTDFFSAPRVYLELTSEAVVVEEFASGMWLWELLAAIEKGNAAVLEQARELNIDAATVARRLLWVNNWAREEHLFFHADPHPKNIILGPDSRLYFINFSATASISRSQRQAVQQNMEYLRQRDPLSMARSSLVLLEPLPAIDVAQLVQELESYNWQLVYAMEADPAGLAWAERTSAVQWIGMIRLARKYRIVVDSRVLRLLRATLLIESTAARLDPDINFEAQYREFQHYRAEQARRRVTESYLDYLEGEPNEKLIIRIDRISHILTGLFFRTRRMLALPTVNFNALMSKWSFAVFILLRFVAQLTAVTGAAALIRTASSLLTGSVLLLDPRLILPELIANPLYVMVVLLLVFANGRTVLFRLDDKDS